MRLDQGPFGIGLIKARRIRVLQAMARTASGHHQDPHLKQPLNPVQQSADGRNQEIPRRKDLAIDLPIPDHRPSGAVLTD